MDRQYDSAQVRQAATRNGLHLIVRMRWDATHPRIMYDAATGKRVTLADEAVRTGQPSHWINKRTGTRHGERRIVRRVGFPGESRTYDLTVGVEVKAAEVHGRRQWVRSDSGKKIVVLAPVGLGHETLRWYGYRWAIETIFYQWALDEASPRPKTIQAHVIQISLHALAKALGACASLIVNLTARLHGAPFRITTVAATQLMVDAAREPD